MAEGHFLGLYYPHIKLSKKSFYNDVGYVTKIKEIAFCVKSWVFYNFYATMCILVKFHSIQRRERKEILEAVQHPMQSPYSIRTLTLCKKILSESPPRTV